MSRLLTKLLSVPLLATGLLLPAAEPESRKAADAELLSRAREVHEKAIVLDSHVDIAGMPGVTPDLDRGVAQPTLRCDLTKMASGGVDGVFWAAFVPQGARDAEGYRAAHETAMDRIHAIRRIAANCPDRAELATSPDQVEAIVRKGRRAVLIGIENGYAMGTDLANLQRFHELGVRYITLSHNGHNQLCDSCYPRPDLGDRPSEHIGLSDLGRRAVAEMNRLGILVDVSHVAPSTFRDVIAVSRAPVIASHSGCRALGNLRRNLDDTQLKALGAKGGVIQIVALDAFLKPQPPARLKDFCDHIDHAVRVAGIDHVGIGTDFDGGGGITGFNSHAEAMNVTVELLRRGYSEEAIGKIWGRNILRAWREAERSR